MKLLRKTKRRNPRLDRIRIDLTVCLPPETAETIRATAIADRSTISRIISQTLVAVFGGPKGVTS